MSTGANADPGPACFSGSVSVSGTFWRSVSALPVVGATDLGRLGLQVDAALHHLDAVVVLDRRRHAELANALVSH